MIKVGIVGDGYTAVELLRIIAGHGQLEPVYISSVDNIGRRVDEVYPQMIGFCDLVCQPTDVDIIKNNCDAVFLALPHGLSVPLVQGLKATGVRCVDLGADFRLKDPNLYQEYYAMRHEAPELLAESVYGLPEIYREQIRSAAIVANPGCYPTSAVIPLAPLLKAGIIEPDHIVVDSKSGVTGAGRALKLDTHFCEVNEGVRAYGLGRHRHGPEIRQELSFASGNPVELIFTPHLIPMSRGILTTIYCRLRPGVAADLVRQTLATAYQGDYFVRILPVGVLPHTKWVYGSNFIDIGIHVTPEGQVILVSALDNLTKGASGQAIQNLNLMMGLPEKMGLDVPGIMP